MDADEIHVLMQNDDLVEGRIVLNLMNIINILKSRRNPWQMSYMKTCIPKHGAI